MEYIVVLVTSCFRDPASAPKVHWQAGAAEAPALEQEPRSSPSSGALTAGGGAWGLALS
jgi:hypothetical protein